MTHFLGIRIECCYAGSGQPCVCSTKEGVVRTIAAGNESRALTPEERAELVSDANHAGEGYYDEAELQAMNDEDLCAATLNAWKMYVQGQL